MTAGEMAAVIAACVSGLGVIGGGVQFLWNKIEARFVAIDSKLEDCERREKAHKERSAVKLTVIELLWQEAERFSPDGSKALTRAAKLLSDLKKETE